MSKAMWHKTAKVSTAPTARWDSQKVRLFAGMSEKLTKPFSSFAKGSLRGSLNCCRGRPSPTQDGVHSSRSLWAKYGTAESGALVEEALKLSQTDEVADP